MLLFNKFWGSRLFYAKIVAGTWRAGILMASEGIPPDLCRAYCLAGPRGKLKLWGRYEFRAVQFRSADCNPHRNWAAGLQSSLLFANSFSQSIEMERLAMTFARLINAGSLVENVRSTSLLRSWRVLLLLCFLKCQKKCFAVYKCSC